MGSDKEKIINNIKSIYESADKDSIITQAKELGLKYEQKYWGCGQSVVLAVLDTFKIRDEGVFRSLSGFGAGVGLTSKSTCCALLGAVAVIGYIFGRDFQDLQRLDRGVFCYKLSKRLVNSFENKYEHLECNKVQENLMGRAYNLWDRQDFVLFEKAGGHLDKCPEVVS